MVKFNNFKIYYRSRGTNYNSNFKSYNHDYYITVVNVDTGVKVGFMYHEGIAHTAGKPDLINALYCLYSDGIAYADYDYNDFCAEFGYEVYDRTSRSIYNSCKRQYEKCKKLNYDIYDIVDVYNALNEAVNG